MKIILLLSTLLIFTTGSACAHFGLILPADDILSPGEARTLELQVKFLHPLEGHYMEMARPKRFGVMTGGRKVSLLDSLQPRKGRSLDQKRDFGFWSADYSVRRPGDYTFYLEPQPYWEPAEDKYIVHYTKVCVNAYGLEVGWDQPVGFETEIIPLSRPYGLWRGNLFSAQVLLKGAPLPFAEVEVEYLNEKAEAGTVHAPSTPFVTQVVRADANGVFHYAMPKSGWWGFAALSEADWQLSHAGSDKAVEIGAVYWVYATKLD